MEILAHKCDDKYTQSRMKYISEKLEQMGNVAKVTAGILARVTTWTVVGDIMGKDVPQSIERHQDIGIEDFDFNEKEVSSRRGRKYERIDLLRLLIHLWPGPYKEQ